MPRLQLRGAAAGGLGRGGEARCRYVGPAGPTGTYSTYWTLVCMQQKVGLGYAGVLLHAVPPRLGNSARVSPDGSCTVSFGRRETGATVA